MSITLGNHAFEGPVSMNDWSPPNRAGVYAIMIRSDPVGKPNTYTVVYLGESGNLSERGFWKAHHKYNCWLRLAGSAEALFIGTYLMPNSAEKERKAVENSLVERYKPGCNDLGRGG